MGTHVILLDLQRAIIITHVYKIVALLCAAFLGITFSQSAFDKISDFKGNKSYFASQFAKTPFKNSVGALLPVVIFLEVNSALACIAGILVTVFMHNVLLLGYGLLSSSCALLFLLLGQRIAKDYAGAASITGYFLIAVLGLIGVAACL